MDLSSKGEDEEHPKELHQDCDRKQGEQPKAHKTQLQKVLQPEN